MILSSAVARVEILCEPGSPDRPTEDAYVFHQEGDWLLLAAIDGATVRVPSTALKPLFSTQGETLTAAAYAAQHTRDCLLKDPSLPPDVLLLRANDALCDSLAAVYGELNAEAVFRLEPGLDPYRHESRFFRLVLPVCVAVAARIDLKAGLLTYAYAGDSVLLIFYSDGRVQQIAWQRHADFQPDPLLAYPLTDASTRIRMNIESALYHNYVDASGMYDQRRGVGCINGLPELKEYLKHGQLPLEGISAVLLCTDGLLWPASPGEDAAEQTRRLHAMRTMIEELGLRGYYQRLRAEERIDSHGLCALRFKRHDDATGLYLQIY